MTLSAIIPVFNAAGFVRETIESVLAQKDVAAETTVVDDGSTDGTAEIASGCGPNVRVVRQSNAGESAARNRGFAESTGEIVVFLDADDLLAPGALAAALRVFADFPESDLVYGRIEYFGEGTSGAVRGHELGTDGRILPAVIRGDTLVPGQFFMRRSLVEKAGPFRTDLRYGEDWEFLLRAARVARCRFLPITVLRKRVHAAMQSLEANRPDIVAQRTTILRGVFGNFYATEAEPLLTRRVLADWVRSFAFSLADTGNRKRARQQVIRSLALWPLQPALWLWLAVSLVGRDHRP